ncbi:MAG: hypothetical protein AABY88_03790 [Pseudomonadota bacterium]
MHTGFKFGILASSIGMMIMAVPASSTPAKPKMLSGTWGGDRMNLAMTAKGGEIRMDCATGTIKGKIIPDAQGRFTASGTFDQERGGPIRAEDFAARGKPAVFRGQVIGETIKLTVTQNDTAAPQSYTLRKGHGEKLVRCL